MEGNGNGNGDKYADLSTGAVWLKALKHQAWVEIGLSLIFFLLPLILIFFLADKKEVDYWDYYASEEENRTVYRHFLIHDGSISRKFAEDDTIPSWVAFLVPIALAVLYIGVCEYIYFFKGKRTKFHAISAFLFFFFDFLNVIFLTLFLTELSKRIVGQLRPDFLERCQPDIVTYECTGDKDDVKDGTKSFPSGHSSIATCVGLYSSLYMCWSLYFREGSLYGDYNAHKAKQLKSAQPGGINVPHAIHQVMHFGALCAILLPFSIAWGISISRVEDGRHGTGDVCGGMILGGVVACLFLGRSIGRVVRITVDIDDVIED